MSSNIDERLFKKCTEEKTKSQGKIPFWYPVFLWSKEQGYDFRDPEQLRDKYRKYCKKNKIDFTQTKMDEKSQMKIMPRPRIAVFDLELLPGISYFWDIWNQNIYIDQIIQDKCLLSWAGKFLNEPEMHSDIMTSKEAKERDASRITKSCWEFLSQADIVIGHNMVGFDAKHANTSFLEYGLDPLKYIIVDTLLVARKNFNFVSNKLEYINQKLGIRNKIENDGFPLWKACSNGDSKALKTMLDYNIGDIGSTEELFYKLRPYVRNINVALYNEILTSQCPVCGSTDLKSEGEYYTPAGKWESVRCQDCRAISRKKENLLEKDKKKSLVINS